MNSRTPFMLLAILAVVGTLTISSAYAQEGSQACVDCEEDLNEAILIVNTAVSIHTDKTEYDAGDIIQVYGGVANISPDFEITVQVKNPLNSVVGVAQLKVAEDATYETSFNTAGSIWQYEGTYTIDVYYGSEVKNNSVRIELGGDSMMMEVEDCSAEEVMIVGYCMTGSISGGAITDSSINQEDNSIIINIDAEEDGTLMLVIPNEVQEGIFLISVDGEEWDDVSIDDGSITVEFLAGAEMIEIFGSHVIPEFGTIAGMVLAVAVVAIIAVSARSKLSIMPKY